MKGTEFLRKVVKIGKQRGIQVEFIPRRGKGSHGTLFFGGKFTIVRNLTDELKTGALHGMLKQIGLSIEELEGRGAGDAKFSVSGDTNS